jgi:hypothetical protein
MTIAQAALNLLIEPPAPWSADWIWGCPLIVVTVIIHVLGLGFVSHWVLQACSGILKRRPVTAFVIVIGTTTLLATVLHAIESGLWAVAYWGIGAVSDYKSAMLYSLGAMTTYGHETQILAEHWRLLGSMEALNGWLLFGLSTAFLFLLIQQVAPKRAAER